MLRKVALVLLLALLLGPAPLAKASDSTFESRLTVTFAEEVIGSGSTRTISYTITVTDTQAGLRNSGILEPNQIRIAFSAYYCASAQPARQIATGSTPPGCLFAWPRAGSQFISDSYWQRTLGFPGAVVDSYSATLPLLLPRVYAVDGNGNTIVFFANYAPPQATVSHNVITRSQLDYDGPLVQGFSPRSPVAVGTSLILRGRKLSEVTSVMVGGVTASWKIRQNDEMELELPPGLKPGQVDLVLQSRYGALTQQDFLIVKTPPPTLKMTFFNGGRYLNQEQVQKLIQFNGQLNSDYTKIRCIVNSADSDTAKRISGLVCAQLARAGARNAVAIQEVRNTYSAKGFWVRVYASG